ncbi:hypothetical protein ACH5A2_40195 [Streptomyces collinus]|uniref:hypothetical protein n=1 Tax=Streptomyces collinus TaxID=42684 RepID=UPI00379113D7
MSCATWEELAGGGAPPAAHAVSGSPVPARLTPLMAAYQELDRWAPGQEAARGRRFNAFLAEVLPWG